MAKKNDPATRHFWSVHTRNWAGSGLTRQGYCDREGLKLSSFEYWRRRLARTSGLIDRTTAPGKALTLVAVRVKDDGLRGAVMLRSPGGWSVAVPGGVGAAFLADVLKRLP